MTEAPSSSRLQGILAHTPAGILEMDAEGLCVFVNDRACEVAEMAANAALGEGWLVAAHADDRERVAKTWRDAVAAKADFRATYRVANGARVHAVARPIRDAGGAVTGFAMSIVDVTPDPASSKSLDQTELLAVLDSAPEAILIHVAGRVRWVNRAFVSLVGAEDAGAYRGREVLDLVHADERPIVRERIEALSAGATDLPSSLVRFARADGTYVAAEWRSSTAALGGERAIVSYGRDVTERKHFEARLVLADRLASVGTLAAGVAHEVNNPLAYVVANLEFLTGEVRTFGGADPSPLAQEMIEVLGEVKDGVERIRRIVRGLKAFARADDEALAPQSFARALDLSAQMVDNEIRHRARLVKEYARTPLVLADEGRLVQVFVNLLLNAAQAIPEGHADSNTIHVVTRTDEAGRVVAEVRDSGVGIPEENLRRIFDPFFTTKEVGTGTGLGLSISHGIISALGGTIHVQSKLGEGTRFIVTLPSAQAAVSPPPPPAAPLPPRPGGPRMRVLVVDDEPLVLRSLERSLGREHDVTTLTTGQEVLRLIESGRRFDVIFCDLMMPTITGMDLYERIAVLAPGQVARIVFLTGGAFTPKSRDFLDSVPNERADKPVDVDELRAIVHRVTGALKASPV